VTRDRRGWVTALTLGLVGVTACATLQQVAALRQVEFQLDRVSAVRLAGVDLTTTRTLRDLSLADAAAFTQTVSRRQLPLEFTLHVRGENPAANRVAARLVQLEWTLLLEDRETVSGTLSREHVFPPGEPQDVPLAISLNLAEFFSENAADLLSLARNLTGQGGTPLQLRLRALPTIQTAIGPMRFPEPVTIVQQTVGQPTSPK